MKFAQVCDGKVVNTVEAADELELPMILGSIWIESEEAGMYDSYDPEKNNFFYDLTDPVNKRRCNGVVLAEIAQLERENYQSRGQREQALRIEAPESFYYKKCKALDDQIAALRTKLEVV